MRSPQRVQACEVQEGTTGARCATSNLRNTCNSSDDRRNVITHVQPSGTYVKRKTHEAHQLYMMRL
eukprot:468819-Lingulodinium_polyedra.AAC.1